MPINSSPRTVVLFGGTGFVGKSIAEKLARHSMIVRLPTRDLDSVRDLRLAGKTGYVAPSLWTLSQSDDKLARLVSGADAVINLLGQITETRSHSFQYLHVETAARLARIASAQGVKQFIHMSALGASATSPSLYAQTKAAGEKAIRAFFPEAVILRPSLILGAESGFLKQMESLARFSPFLPLIGGGETKFQPVFVEDVADAALRALTEPSMRGHSFELTGPQTMSLKEILGLWLKLTGRKRVLVPLSWTASRLLAMAGSILPTPPLTQDQILMLQKDSVRSGSKSRGFEDIGIIPKSMAEVLPHFLEHTA